jgi:hypothetical protein
MDILPLSDVPNELLASISEAITRHSVALLRVWFDPPGVDNILQVGAGTLVQGPNVCGIVTAFHVAREFSGECFLGLTTSTTGDDFKIHASQVTILPVDSPADGEYGPDLAFIEITPSDRNEIARDKEFYRLSLPRSEVLLAPPTLDAGIWVACGCPQQRSRIDPGEGRFAALAAFQLFCGFGGVDRQFHRSGLDYLEMPIDNPGRSGVPSRFEGMSGGGLWQVPIAVLPGGQLRASRYLYSGVVFWRAPLPDGRILLRSHGRQSIYERLFQLI